MHTIETTFNSDKDPFRETTIKIAGKRNVLTRLNQLAKSSDWDEKIPAIENWIGKICRTVIGFSAIYFIAVLIFR